MGVVDSVVYRIDCGAVSATGHSIGGDHAEEIAAEVQAILRDDAGVQDAYAALADVAKTDFETDRLQKVLASPESFDEWRVGEALGEHQLVGRKGCKFPWPDSRSMRNPNCSRGGVDLIGFQSGEHMRFVFAEVKTSQATERSHEPFSRSGRSIRRAERR